MNIRTLHVLFFTILFAAINGQAQLSGSYSVPGTYTSIGAVINDINLYGITAPVVINVSPGHTETSSVGGYSLYTIVGGSALNTVTFQKSGPGTNPVINAYSGVATASSTVQDGIWRFIGADNVIVDGIDLYDANTTISTSMEFGFVPYPPITP